MLLQDRKTMGHWSTFKINKDEMRAWQTEWNADSLDGLPGMTRARRDRGEVLWLTGSKAWARRMAAQRDAVACGVVLAVVLYLFLAWVQRLLGKILA